MVYNIYNQNYGQSGSFMSQTTKEILDNFFAESQTGTVYLNVNTDNHPWKFGIELFANIEGKNNATNDTAPVVQIPNYQHFVEHVESYLSVAEPFYVAEKDYFDLTDDSYKKKLIADLFASATNFDFNDISSFVDLRTTQLQNTLPTDEPFELGTLNGATIFAKIKKNPSNLEGPYNMELFASKKKEIYPLPSVTFAIANNNLYVYALKYTDLKSVDPITQKTMHTVIDGKPILDTKFKEDMNAYFHTITLNSHSKGVERNVSPNSLVSLAMFLSFFKGSGVKEVIAPDFMPLRYSTNQEAIKNKYASNPELLEERLDKHDNDQNNITNKFMYLFLRYNRNFPENEIEYDDMRQEMHMTLSPTKTFGENLIYQIDQMGQEQNDLSK